MKSIIMPKTVQLNEELKKQAKEELLEVKETLAEPDGENTRDRYTAVDMWNHQRNSRSATDRMRRWNMN